MTQEDTTIDFIETADIIWETVQIDAENVNHFHELYRYIQKTIEEKRLLDKGILLSITLLNIHLKDKELTSIQNGELLQAIEEEEMGQESFVWPIQIHILQSFTWDREQLEGNQNFMVNCFKTADNLDAITDSISPLYDHPIATKFLEPLSEKENHNLQQDALQILMRLLN